MRKFKPLDLSFIASSGSAERENFRNVAQYINANAGWSTPSQTLLQEYAVLQEQAKKEAEKQKPTFISGLFDLLSTPLYGVANAMDEALAGHQSDVNDSVLSDVGKTTGGVFTGLARGLGAGLRGATSMLPDAFGISPEWQRDPEDKTRMADVAIRNETGMSTAEAMDPANWEKAKGKLKEAQDKSVWNKTFYELFIPEDLDDPEAQAEFLKNYQLVGIANDIGADPLNFIPFGLTKKAADLSKLTEGLEAARTAKGPVGISAAEKAGPTFAAKEAPAAPGKIPSYVTTALPEIRHKLGFSDKEIIAYLAKRPDMTPGGMASIKLALKGLPKSSSGIPGSEALASLGGKTPFPDLPRTFAAPKAGEGAFEQGKLGRLIEIPKPGAKFKPSKGGQVISRVDQDKLVKDITRLAVAGHKGWVYKAADMLGKHPNVDFEKTLGFLQLVHSMSQKGVKHNPAGLGTLLRARVTEDAQKARGVTTAGQLLNKYTPDQLVIRPAKAKLRPQQQKIADDVIARFTPEILGSAKAPGTGEALRAMQQAGVNARWSGPQQVRMWNHLTTKLAKLPPQVRYDVAAKILQHVEDHFLVRGVKPYSGAKIKESVEGLRLSHIAQALGPKVLADNPSLVTRLLKGDEKALASLTPEQAQAIENLKASEAVSSAPATKVGIAAGKDAVKDILAKSQSVGRTSAEMIDAVRHAERVTAAAGGGPVAAKTAGAYIGRLITEPGGISAFYRAKSLEATAWLSDIKRASATTTKADKKFKRAETRHIARAAELPPSPTLGNVAGPAARVKDWLGARFNAAYGVRDMRPIFLRNQASALSTSARRTQLINQIARQYPPSDVDLWHEAFRAAQADGLTAGPVSGLQGEISKVMENLFGGTGLKAGAIADSTVVGRNRLYMKELNAQLKRFGLGQYQFTADKKVKDALGAERDFSKGADWLKSWETWEVKDPYTFLHKVQNAIEHTVREKNMFDEVVERFGSDKRFGNVKYGVNHPRLKGYYFTEEGARQADQFVKILKEVNTPNSKSMQHIDHVISKMKAALTIYIPSHHWTNVIGDVMFNWFAGVNSPRRYEQAIKVMTSQKGRYGDISEFKNLAGPDAFKQALARGMVGTDALTEAGLKVNPVGNQVITTMKNGQKVTSDMIYTAMMKEGILPSARVLEEVTSDVSSVLDKFRPLGGRGQRAAHVVSEVRDHIPRIAQFIDGLSKHGGSFANAVEDSAAAVRKWHPDGLDLTKFERNVLKRVFPFYSWTRKAIPLAIESALLHGNKVMAYPRLMEAIALSNGIDAPPGEMFPTDQPFTDWMRERGIGPVAGGPGSYLMVNPSTPALDIFTMMGHPGQSALDMLNPFARVPLELSQGATLGKQVPIESTPEYLAQQIPGISQAGRVTGAYGTSKAVAESPEQQRLNLINLLTGGKATQSGIYQKSAQFDIRDYLTQRAKEARGG